AHLPSAITNENNEEITKNTSGALLYNVGFIGEDVRMGPH
ncbi:MAG: hypothetical protein QOE88_2460, partial [Verrucomicrobiota bacterium]|nr:hypothetical protein [Verrucomicrobiota bacterium]